MKNICRFLSLASLTGFLLFTGCGEESEPSKIAFELEASDLPEGGDVTVSFSLPLPAGVTPEITLSGTAEETTDYTYTVSSAGLTFNAVDDGIYDPGETIIIRLTGFNKGAIPGALVEHTITLSEAPVVVEFQTQAISRIEGLAVVAAFSQQLPAAVVPTYTISGNATLSTDFSFTQNSNGFVVSTKADQVYDKDETVVIELTQVTGNATIGEKKTFTLTISDEDETAQDGLKLDLTWEATDLVTSDVDVDLMVWRETSPGVYTALGGLWAAVIGTAPESTFIPISEPDGKYALSYVYFYGTSNNLKIKADFRSYKGNINGASNRASFSKVYTLVNINSYTDPYLQPLVIAQTFDKTGGNFSNLSDINVASSGSRLAQPVFLLDEKAREVIRKKLSIAKRRANGDW